MKNTANLQQSKFRDTFGIVQCTVCSDQVNPFIGNEMMEHPTLKVIICKACFKFFRRGDWTKDEEGKEEQCQWCGEGGEIILCDQCCHSLCKKCIKKNVGRTFLTNLEKEPHTPFQCFVCDPKPIGELQKRLQEIIIYVNNVRKQNAALRQKSSTSVDKIIEKVATPEFQKLGESTATVAGDIDVLTILKKLVNSLDVAKKSLTSISDNVKDDEQDFYTSNKDKRKVVSSIKSIIDSLTDGLSFVSSRLDIVEERIIQNLEPIKKARNLSINKTNTAAAASAASFETTTKTSKSNIKKKLFPNRRDVNKTDVTVEEEVIEIKLEEDDDDDDRNQVLNELGINSDGDVEEDDYDDEQSAESGERHQTDTVSTKLLKNSEKCDSKLENSNATKEHLTMTPKIVIERIKGKVNGNGISSAISVIPETDSDSDSQSSTVVGTDEELDSLMNSQGKRKHIAKASSKETSEKRRKIDEKSSKDGGKNSGKNDEEGFDSELEKRLKAAKAISLATRSKRTSNKTESLAVSSKKFIIAEKRKTEKRKSSDEDDGIDISDYEEDDSEEKPEDCLKMSQYDSPSFDERDRCLSALGIGANSNNCSEDDLENGQEDVEDEEEEVVKKNVANKVLGKRRQLAKDDIIQLSDGDGDQDSTSNSKFTSENDDKSETKSKSTIPKNVQKLLKTKINFRLDDEEENDNMISKKSNAGKTKSTATKKKGRKILSSDEEEKKESESDDNDDDDNDDEIPEFSEFSSEEDGKTEQKNKNGAAELDSDLDDNSDFVSSSKAITNRRRTAKRTSKKGGKSQKRSRKRVAVPTDDDDDEGSENEDDLFQSKTGRKNIRNIKVRGLAQETVDAYEAEKERRKRISERQKLYNAVNEDDELASQKSIKELSPVLEKDNKTGEILIQINQRLFEKLKPHQVDGVRFLYLNTIESVEKAKEAGNGCILAHCMGLGKTLQVITYLHTILSNEQLHMKTALVIAPLNVVLNWKHEFCLWLDNNDLSLDVFEMSSVKANADRAKLCDTWQEDGGVLIISYSLYRILASGQNVKKEKWKTSFKNAFLDPGPDVVVCDEGHILKNEKTGISKVINVIQTKRRVCLTGTPLQNNLDEYYTMVQFVKPNLLGSKAEFMNRFGNPIKNGQYEDSTPDDVRIMKRRAHCLHKMLSGCMHRQDYTALAQALPPKHEYVLSIKLSDRQKELYQHYLDTVVGSTELDALKFRRALFPDYQVFQRIWTHPYGLILHLLEQQRKMDMEALKNEDDSFIDDDEEDYNSETSEDEKPKKKKRKVPKENEEDDDDVVEIPIPKNEKKTERTDNDNDDDIEILGITRTYRTRGNPGTDQPLITGRPSTPIETRGWFNDLVTEEDRYKLELAGKFVLLFEILRKCEAIGDKVLVFSQSLIALDLIEIFLDLYNKTGWDCHPESLSSLYKWRWKAGQDYFRLDGSTSADKRKQYAKAFNDPNNFRARLFLISTRAGSLGMNLFGANRVIVFDASWNPTHDVQSMFRVYRFGQTKPVYIYRFVSKGTMEETIYERGVTKQSLSCRVVDEHQIDRHFSGRDLEALYRFNPYTERNENVPLPKDRLLADLWVEQKDWILSYHEHDSLLRNLEEEKLTDEEQKTAWEEYENERKNPHMGYVGNRNSLPFNNLPLSNDRYALFLAAMPALRPLIAEGNRILRLCGGGMETNVENVVKSWIYNDPAVARNPMEALIRLQKLIEKLQICEMQRPVVNDPTNPNWPLGRGIQGGGASTSTSNSGVGGLFPRFPL